VERGRAPTPYIVTRDADGTFHMSAEERARLDAFIDGDDFSPEADARHGDDRGSGKAIQWLARVVFAAVLIVIGSLLYGLWWAFDTWGPSL
jgi:hypothetical protein